MRRLSSAVITAGFIFLLVLKSYASHNRAGEITYKHVGGNTYEITIITYTKEDSPADRPILDNVKWGDGESDSLYRQNGPDLDFDGIGDGEIIATDIKMNIYKATHTYPGPGTYQIGMLDPNRNGNIINMNNSFDTPFYIEIILKIDPFINPNNSPDLSVKPIDDACIGKLFVHNPGAIDPDGDSLSYELVPSMKAPGTSVDGYVFPPGVTIDPVKGDLFWNSPQQKGEFNFAIKIWEWRNGKKIAYIIRDMQVTVDDCVENPPFINDIADTCVTAGNLLTLTVSAYDPDSNNVELTATGDPFAVIPAATFASSPPAPSLTGTFTWSTQCPHVRKQPYMLYFKAKDLNVTNPLVYFETVMITVVGPAPENPSASPVGNAIKLAWEQSVCSEVTGYKIYRRVDSAEFVPALCETGVPSYTGYSFIAAVSGNSNTTYTDNNNNTGLIHGNLYCYMVVADFPDGAESYASVEFCAELKRDAPVITHVSVNNTDAVNGADTVIWSMPTELDTALQYPGPYQYKIYRSSGFGSASTFIASTASAGSLTATDTVFVDSPVNTKDTPQSYRIELYSGDNLVGSTQTASSIYLSTVTGDNMINLSWQETVPWSNKKYVVYKKDTPASAFKVIDTVTAQNYVDTGLVNGAEYCYYVQSIGSYSSSGIINPILNRSQEKCEVPIDLTPPCPPVIILESDCKNAQNLLIWNNPNNSCTDDVILYSIYYTPVFGEPLKLVQKVYGAADTTFLFSILNSVAGCYGITASDSVKVDPDGNVYQNESALSDTVCADNCPVYHLPNTFSPDENGINDKFIPFDDKKYIESIDIKIYNRWGILVFQTDDLNINWDGRYQRNKKECVDGVYYYVCEVNEIRLAGVEKRTITGFIQLFRDKNNITK